MRSALLHIQKDTNGVRVQEARWVNRLSHLVPCG